MEEFDSADQLIYNGAEFHVLQVVLLQNGPELRPQIKLDGQTFTVFGYQRFRRKREDQPFRRLELIPNFGGRLVVLTGGFHEYVDTTIDYLDIADATPIVATGATTPRTLADRFSDLLSVKDFGATGDGVTDDTAAIQAAVNTGAAAGKTVIVPPGTYMINIVTTGGAPGFDDQADAGGVKLPSNTHLIIQRGAVLQAITSNWYAGRVLRITGGVSNVTVEGPGEIRGERSTHNYANPAVPTSPDRRTAEWNFGILIRNAVDVTISGLTITECTGDAIETGDDLANPTTRVRIVNNRLDNSRRNNISIVGGSSDVQIIGNVITNAGQNIAGVSGTPPRAGIDVEGGAISTGGAPLGTLIQGNTFRGNWGQAVSNFNGIGTVIVGNTSDGTLSYGNGVDTTIAGNTLRENPMFVPANLPAFNIGTTYLKGDRVQNAGAFFTSTQDGNTGNTPPNATFWQTYAPPPGISGLAVAGGMDTNSASITGNAVNGFDTAIDVRGANVVVAGNHVYKPRSKGLSTFSVVGVVFEGNEVFQAATGIWLDGTATHATAAGNYIEGATTTGILSNSPSALIRGNMVRSSIIGIRVTAGTAEVSQNNIRPDGVAGESNSISVSGATTVAYVNGNSVRGAANTPFLATGSPILRLVRNEFTGLSTASFAISITSTARVELIDNVVAFARGAAGGTGIALLGGTANALVLSNKIYNENPVALTNSIKTDTSAGGNKIINNITQAAGAMALSGTDTSTGNVTF